MSRRATASRRAALLLRLDHARRPSWRSQRARAEQQAAEAQLRLLQAGSRREDISQAEAQAQAARDEVQAAGAELAAAEADLQRFEALLEANAGSRKQRDDALARRDVARERVQATREPAFTPPNENVARLRAGRQAAGDRRRARACRVPRRPGRDRRGGAQRCGARLADARQSSRRSSLKSAKCVAPGAPVLVIIDLDHAWADVFVPEPVIPRIRIGQPATLFTDAGGSGLPGTMTFISPKAEFTPRNVQTAEERSKLVYRVRVTVDNAQGHPQGRHAGRSRDSAGRRSS